MKMTKQNLAILHKLCRPNLPNWSQNFHSENLDRFIYTFERNSDNVSSSSLSVYDCSLVLCAYLHL